MEAIKIDWKMVFLIISFYINSFLFIFWKIIFLFEGKNILLKGKVQYNPIEI